MNLWSLKGLLNFNFDEFRLALASFECHFDLVSLSAEYHFKVEREVI